MSGLFVLYFQGFVVVQILTHAFLHCLVIETKVIYFKLTNELNK